MPEIKSPRSQVVPLCRARPSDGCGLSDTTLDGFDPCEMSNPPSTIRSCSRKLVASKSFLLFMSLAPRSRASTTTKCLRKTSELSGYQKGPVYVECI